jgi:hypothetical protein
LKEYRKKLKVCIKKLQKYRKQRENRGNCNSYSKTDPDAPFMRMKDETLKAAYNVRAAVEGEYLTGAGSCATPNDGANLKPFLERLKVTLGNVHEQVTVDAGYESEVTVYECEDCEGCPLRERCTASQKNRRMDVSKKLLAFCDESEENIKGDEGILLRANRSTG